MALSPENTKVALDKVTQIYRYLLALDQLRNPIKRLVQDEQWALWLRDLPEHPGVMRNFTKLQEENESADDSPSEGDADNTSNNNANFIVKVTRPSLTSPPAPPPLLISWLKTAWDNPAQTPLYNNSQTNEGAQDISSSAEGTPGKSKIAEKFHDDSERVTSWDEWIKKWETWATSELPARRTMELYEKLYDLHSQMARESEKLELVVGDGILNWQHPNGKINHPLLLQRLQLIFDADKYQFSFVETDQPVIFHTSLFRGLTGIDGPAIRDTREEVENNLIQPLGDETTDALLQRLAARLDVHGQFVAAQPLKGELGYPRIARDPIIFLRARTQGFATALERIIEDIPSNDSVSNALLGVVGIEPPPSTETLPSSAIPAESFCDGNEDQHVLLSKEANLEQLAIAQRLASHGGVLVQGPPGTGKTHTIANLVGHLLAQGKTVLVTSHTTKALGVLREKVVPQLQPLCVSVLDSDADSRHQLENSVRTIVERLASSDEHNLDKLAHAAAHRRLELIKELHITRAKLFHARASEYRDLIIAGESISPVDAARYVKAHANDDDWIPSPIQLSSPLPMSLDDLNTLYDTNESFSPQDEEDTASVPPAANQILNPDDFEKFVLQEVSLKDADLTRNVELWADPSKPQQPHELENLQERIRIAIGTLHEGEEWRLAAIAAGQTGSAESKTWENLIEQIEVVRTQASLSKELFLNYGPALTDDVPYDQQEKNLTEIYSHLERGGNLNAIVLFARRHWKIQIEKSRVGDSKPETKEHFEALSHYARLEEQRNFLSARWERQMTQLGAPTTEQLGKEPESICTQYIPILRECLEWQKAVWQPLEDELRQTGLDWQKVLERVPPVLSSYAELKRLQKAVQDHLPEIIESQCNRLKLQYTQRVQDELERRICGATSFVPDNKSIRGQLHNAFLIRDVVRYREIHSRLLELEAKQEVAQQRKSLLHSLGQIAPTWAKLIETRQVPHHQRIMPGDVHRAWKWRQLHDELEERDNTSIAEIQKKLDSITNELRKVTIEQIDSMAWAEQVRRTTVPQRKALVGWVQTIKKIGKGTGKRVPRLQAEARKLMNECRNAVPVWVMPLTRVVENFDPQTTKFDVVIIDEASQSDVMGLLAFYLGRQVVVVGDDEQVSPDAVGQKLDEVQHLIDEHLSDIPNANLYDGTYSVYDVALSSFGGTICLREHFRCVPDIINFSNHLSYNGDIKPLRDASTVQLKPHVVSYCVESAFAQNKVNEVEAISVASLIVAASEQPEYEDATFGVISMVGIEQAARIDLLLRHHMKPVELERRRIVCGNAPHFQGDERDVMFISMVDAPKDGPLSMNERPAYRKRLNVAASRARDQMWVVHSLQPEIDLKAGDLRRRFLEYAHDPGAIERAIEKGESHVESEFERLVLNRLIGAGYRVIPQWKVGAFRIDLVVEGSGKRLAVECDGDRYHALDKLPDDMARQAMLERLGWNFVRIRGSEFFRNPDRAIEPVFNRLKQMGIAPEGNLTDITPSQTHHGAELIERVIRRAIVVREEWQEEHNL